MRFLAIDCFLIWIIFHMTIWQCCCNQFFDFRVSNLNKCWQIDDYVLRMFSVSLQRCVEESGKRQVCKGINYRRKVKQCELIPMTTTADLVINTIADGPCISVHRNDIQTQTNCSCSAHEVCDPTGVCNVQECLPFSITNGNYLGNLNKIGARVMFTCDSGFTEANNESTATCLGNGDWSVIPQCCTDIDECDAGTNTCDDNAVCENTQSSYTCICNSGYTGDGESCTDVNECDADTNTCDVNAECENTEGSYTCTCNFGYTGDGESCTDVNECDSETDTCDDNAECENDEGSYTCTCTSGYTGDGESCADINECVTVTDICIGNAECENTEGSYICFCNGSPYTGQCPNDFIKHDGSCYLFGLDILSWNGAMTYCQANCGSHLVHVDDQAENDWIVSQIGDSAYWINLSDSLVEGSWMWDDTGLVANYRNWASGQPNNYGNEDCAMYKDSFWRDLGCDQLTYNPKPFCEIEIR